MTYLTPDRSGRIDPQVVGAALRPDTVLVSIMFANNEIGVLQDVRAIGAICRERGVAFHTDAAQAVGKIAVDSANCRWMSSRSRDISSMARRVLVPCTCGAQLAHCCSQSPSEVARSAG